MYKPKCDQFQPRFREKINGSGGSDCLFYIEQLNQAGYCGRSEMYRCLMDVGSKHIPLSFSTVGDFTTCHRLYYLKAIRGIKVRNSQMSNALKMGRLWDSGLQKLLGKEVDLNSIVDDYEINNREIAKVKALYRAYKALEIKAEPGYDLQAKFNNVFDCYESEGFMQKVWVKGFYDRKYPNYFVENKLSSRPDNYLDLFFITSQVGTYFLADPSMEYCVMEVVRTPDLKSTGSYKNEDDDAYGERCYQDIISRPSYYFIGYNKTSGTYGKKFYRSEFDLEEIRSMYRMVSVEIHDACGFDGFYKNVKVCNSVLPGIVCDFQGVCQHNVMSEIVYQIRTDKGGE